MLGQVAAEELRLSAVTPYDKQTSECGEVSVQL
jgi:hypothetical protein